jgi:hypothetical protein
MSERDGVVLRVENVLASRDGQLDGPDTRGGIVDDPDLELQQVGEIAERCRGRLAREHRRDLGDEARRCAQAEITVPHPVEQASRAAASTQSSS